MMKFMILV